MKKCTITMFLVFFCACGIAQFTYGQLDTGIVQGQVLGEDGFPIPDVDVSIIGPTIMGGKLIAKTDERGAYRFSRVPLGDYVVEFKGTGFVSVRRENIKVSPGSRMEVNAVLQMEKLQEEVSVIAEAPVLDSIKPSFNKSVDKETLMILPVNRGGHVEEIANFNPGDSYEATLGQGWYSSAFILDGADATDVGGGDAWLVPNYETVEEVQYIYGGANAEYGDFIGSVVKTITKTGSNRFFGAVGIYFTNDKLTARNTDEEWGTWTQKNNTYDFSLGGPIKRDNVWFYGSVFLNPSATQYRHNDGISEYIYRQYSGKITSQFHPNHRTNISFFWMFNTALGWGQDNPYAEPSTYYDMDMKSRQYALNHTSFLRKNLILDAVVSYHATRYYYPPASNEPQVNNFVTGSVTGGSGFLADTRQDNFGASAKLSLYLDDLAGSHEWKLGFEYQFGGRGSETGFTGGMLVYDYGYMKMGILVDPYWNRQDVRRVSTFLQDDWTIGNRLTIGAGLRYDDIHGLIGDQKQPDGTVIKGPGSVAHFKCLAPRVAATYELTDDGKTMLRASWGRYFQNPPSGMFGAMNPARPVYRYATEIAGEWVVYRENQSVARKVDPNLSNYHNDLFTVSIERQLFKNTSISLNYMKRWSKNYYGTVPLHSFRPVQIQDSYSGEIWTVYDYNPPTDYLFTNIPDEYNLFDTYDAFQIVFNKRFSDKWYLNMSYHYERTWGTTDNGYNMTTPEAHSGYIHYGVSVDPNWQINREGYPLNHRPHQFKMTAAYEFPWNITASTFVSYMSGNPWNRIHFVFTPDVNVDFNAEPKGSRRMPSQFMVDLNLRKTFRIKGSLSLDLAAQIYNLFNAGTITSYWQATGDYREMYFGQPYSNVNPRQFILEAKFRF